MKIEINGKEEIKNFIEHGCLVKKNKVNNKDIINLIMRNRKAIS